MADRVISEQEFVAMQERLRNLEGKVRGMAGKSPEQAGEETFSELEAFSGDGDALDPEGNKSNHDRKLDDIRETIAGNLEYYRELASLRDGSLEKELLDGNPIGVPDARKLAAEVLAKMKAEKKAAAEAAAKAKGKPPVKPKEVPGQRFEAPASRF